jgi:O-succinylbenzoate synthase
MRVFSIPLAMPFRGIRLREGVLIRGESGWGEWSPFTEYAAEVAEPWLRCAEEAAAGDWPEPVRESVQVNATVPVVSPEVAHTLVLRSGCGTAKIKVADPGSTLADDLARVEAVRDALGPTGKVRVDANGAWSVDDAVAAFRARSAVRARRSRGAQSPGLFTRDIRRSPPSRRPDHQTRYPGNPLARVRATKGSYPAVC